jgi:hypothetical protein
LRLCQRQRLPFPADKVFVFGQKLAGPRQSIEHGRVVSVEEQPNGRGGCAGTEFPHEVHEQLPCVDQGPHLSRPQQHDLAETGDLPDRRQNIRHAQVPRPNSWNAHVTQALPVFPGQLGHFDPRRLRPLDLARSQGQAESLGVRLTQLQRAANCLGRHAPFSQAFHGLLESPSAWIQRHRPPLPGPRW